MIDMNTPQHQSSHSRLQEPGVPAIEILVIEDEEKVALALQHGLEAEHYHVTVAHTGEDGFFLLNSGTYDLVLLDLSLPGRDGLEILKTMREGAVHTPVLVLTARDSVEDRVLGLETGADDYMVKPFAFSELLARVRALLRRGRTDQVLTLGLADLELDLVTRKVTRGSVSIDLTAKEFDLLEHLLRHRGRTVSRGMIANAVWNESTGASTLNNIIDVHIARLRTKVDAPFATKLIRTVRGVGFILSDTDS